MPHSTAPEPTKLSPIHNVEEQLYVNDGPLDSNRISRLRVSRPDESLDELRARYDADGYIYLKHLLPRDFVLRARKRYFSMMEPTGLLKKDTDPVEGKFDLENNDPDKYPGIGAGAAGGNGRPGGQAAAQFVDLALQAHYEDWYAEEFCKASELKEFIAKLTGWGPNTLGVKRSLLRNNVPGTKAIGVHYDQIFLRHGEPTSVTAWVPIGDITIDGGGLIYLENGNVISFLYFAIP
jgi:phytanoyl-CoA hydroxylase